MSTLMMKSCKHFSLRIVSPVTPHSLYRTVAPCLELFYLKAVWELTGLTTAPTLNLVQASPSSPNPDGHAPSGIDNLDSNDDLYTSSLQHEGSHKSTRATIGGDTPKNFHLVGATPYSQLPWCTVIVLTKEENKWVELHCHIGKGNASPSTNGLMRGLMAMKSHLTFSHDQQSLTMDDVIDKCTKRVVPLQEVHRICQRMEDGMP